MNDEDLLTEARERFKAASDAESLNRIDWLDDLRFLALDQWPDGLKRAREHDRTAPARVWCSINATSTCAR